MNNEQTVAYRLNKISITNYKGIDKFEFEFPHPHFSDEPDVTLICGRNGVGKSSFLESCALILMTPNLVSLGSEIRWDNLPTDINPIVLRLPNLLVRSGSRKAEIIGEIERKDKQFTAHLIVDSEHIHLDCEPQYTDDPSVAVANCSKCNVVDTICRILGYGNNPAINNCFMYFNHARRIGFESPSIGNKLWSGSNFDTSNSTCVDSFKNLLLEIMMKNTNFIGYDCSIDKHAFDNDGLLEEDINSKALNYFKHILKQYTGGVLFPLNTLPDKSSDIIIEIEEGRPFSFDGLGSAQKEIISILFLMWNYSKNSPMVILMDKPEMHLNAEWQKKFVLDTFSISNQNQFIYATHSEDVVDSVDLERCFILKR